ncbi:MAG: hypothetical protein HQ538_05555, partial [Parcubacteria group bacterium]|nr:hypothetical protein [Parcubacteria group bacterium]
SKTYTPPEPSSSDRDKTLVDLKAPKTEEIPIKTEDDDIPFLDEAGYKLEETTPPPIPEEGLTKISDKDIVEEMSLDVEKQFQDIDSIKGPQDKVDKMKEILPLYFQNEAEKNAYMRKAEEIDFQAGKYNNTSQTRVHEIPNEGQAIDAEIALDKAIDGEYVDITYNQFKYLNKAIENIEDAEEREKKHSALRKLANTEKMTEPRKVSIFRKDGSSEMVKTYENSEKKTPQKRTISSLEEKGKIASKIESFRQGRLNTNEARLILASLYESREKHKDLIQSLEKKVKQAEKVEDAILKIESREIDLKSAQEHLKELDKKYRFNPEDPLYGRLKKKLEAAITNTIRYNIANEETKDIRIHDEKIDEPKRKKDTWQDRFKRAARILSFGLFSRKK